jgi:hypothetical protein
MTNKGLHLNLRALNLDDRDIWLAPLNGSQGEGKPLAIHLTCRKRGMILRDMGGPRFHLTGGYFYFRQYDDQWRATKSGHG